MEERREREEILLLRPQLVKVPRATVGNQSFLRFAMFTPAATGRTAAPFTGRSPSPFLSSVHRSCIWKVKHKKCLTLVRARVSSRTLFAASQTAPSPRPSLLFHPLLRKVQFLVDVGPLGLWRTARHLPCFAEPDAATRLVHCSVCHRFCSSWCRPLRFSPD